MAFKRASRDDVTGGGEGNFFDLRRYRDEILAFEVLLYDPDYENRWHETGAAVKANVTVVTGPDRGITWEKEWITAQVIVRTLAGLDEQFDPIEGKSMVGDTYVGRLYKGKAYSFNEIDDDEWADAEKLLTGGGLTTKSSDHGDGDDEPPF